MPTYGYECGTCGDRFEVQQRITDDALKVHDGCGGALKKLVYPVGIAFKGSGFYVNDYASKPAGGTSSASSASSNSETKADSKTETKTEVKAEPSSSARETVSAS
jgi:putative FmdB family regulatory protein